MISAKQRQHWADLAESQKVHARQRRQEQMAAWAGVLEPNTRLIPLRNGQFSKIDADDFEKIDQFNWGIDGRGYAARVVKEKKKQRTILMHREILNAPKGTGIDHKNRDKLDNRKSNLRFATQHQNQGNVCKHRGGEMASKYKGVQFHKRINRFTASGRSYSKSVYLGCFKSEIDAARAYNEWAKKYFGEFACLNPV